MKDYRFPSLSIKSYLDQAASRTPAPGGGSVSALTAALGASMVSMVANFTHGKKKYEDVQEEIKNILAKSEELRGRLSELVEEDVKAYTRVSSAYALPKETESQKKEKSQEITVAIKEAVSVPLELAECSFKVLELCQRLVDIGNKNLISDVGVAVCLAEASLRGANLNVEINLSSLKDSSFIEKTRSHMEELLRSGSEILKEVMSKVMNMIG